jgi:hypothetical protein
MADSKNNDGKTADGKTVDGTTTELSKLYDQSFWLYTVIIALAIRQVFIEIIPRFLNYYFGSALPLPTPEPNPSAFYIELVRSLVFLIVITRFYLGGVLVFGGLTQDPAGPPKGSWVHVLTGFVHFLLFFAWAYTPFITAQFWRASLFVWVLILILLWDVFWFLLSPESQRAVIKSWLYRNLRTVICMVIIIFIANLWFSAQVQETVVFVLVVFISVADLREMFSKKKPPSNFLAFP